MFIGHFGAGFAAKSLTTKISLGTLLIAAQFIDLLWPTFLLLGVERVRIEPGATVVTPLVFESYPLSHSLLMVAGWALFVAAIYFLLRRDRFGAAVLGTLVISHWLLDALVHQPDLPLLPGGVTMIGLHAWSSLPLTLAIELPLFAFGVWLYSRATFPLNAMGRWGYIGLVVFLLAIYSGNLIGPPPPNTMAIAWAGQLQWLLVLWGYWIDRHRQARTQN